jgi:hypothetical protein
MGERPRTRYERNGQVHLAFQVVGEGALALVGSAIAVDDGGEHEQGRPGNLAPVRGNAQSLAAAVVVAATSSPRRRSMSWLSMGWPK